MFFKQIVKEDLGCASYILGCSNANVCAVVDPRIDMVDDILEIAASKGMKVVAVIETHIHADHISGYGEIARRTGARVYIHEQANMDFPHQKLHDDDELQIGVAKLRVMHTTGHRPEHIALVVSDVSRSDDPWLVLTGDSLFIGDVARPDLAVAAEIGASDLYQSIFHRLLTLEDGVEVYPSHVSGSLCGRAMNAKTSSTIGFERKHNAALQPRSRNEFIHDINENMPQRPPNLETIVVRNRTGESGHIAAFDLLALSLQKFLWEMEHGALVVDIREPDAFAQGHIPGALHVFLRGTSFATRIGFIAPPTSRLLLVVENEQDAHEAIKQLAVVGYDKIAGYLKNGMTAWLETNLPTQSLNQITAELLFKYQNEYTLLDVRDQNEWDEGYIDHSIHIPYYCIEQRMQEIDLSRPVAVLCASGQRSAIACAILQKHNIPRIFNLIGGIQAWKRAGFGLVHQR